MIRSSTSIAALAALLTSFAASGAPLAGAGDHEPRSWHDVKCVRDWTAWSGALTRLGTRALGREFLDRHDAFLASNCTAKADVCPRSAEEFKLANLMIVLAMNAGTASTFPPFACRK